MTQSALWVHPHLTDVFAVRLTFGQVTGVCALSFSEAVNASLLRLEYDGREEAIARARDRPEQFCLLKPWWGGEEVRPMAVSSHVEYSTHDLVARWARMKARRQGWGQTRTAAVVALVLPLVLLRTIWEGRL